MHPGEITFAVMARTETNEPGRRINASIGLARPSDPSMYGYISEHHGYGKDEVQSGEYAEDLAATMLASTLGIEFDPDAAWNERKHIYETSSLIIDSKSITAFAEGDRSGLWTCALSPLRCSGSASEHKCRRSGSRRLPSSPSVSIDRRNFA